MLRLSRTRKRKMLSAYAALECTDVHYQQLRFTFDQIGNKTRLRPECNAAPSNESLPSQQMMGNPHTVEVFDPSLQPTPRGRRG